MPVSYRVGMGWCDVVWTIHGWRLCNALPGAVEIGWGDVWASSVVPTDHLRYLRGASNPAGEVAAIGVGADDHAYLVTPTGVRGRAARAHDLGLVYRRPSKPSARESAAGQNAVGLYWAFDDWVPVIQRSNTVYSVGDVVRKFPFPEGTSQGFRDTRPDGTIIFGDDAHVVTIAGVTLHKPMTRGAVTVGQINGPDRIDGAMAGMPFSAIPGPAFEPHVAQGHGERYAICARTEAGAAVIEVPPYPAVPVTGPPVVVPPIVVPPVHPPEVPPVATPPPDNGIEHGIVVNPKHFYLSLVWDKHPREFATVILNIRETLWAAGIGFQTRSNGTPTSRLFLPTALCPNAQPGTNADKYLGVRQDARCWDEQGRFVNTVENDSNGVPIAWTWDEHGGPAYLPLAGVVTPPPPVEPPVHPPNPQPPVPPVNPTGLEGRVAQLEREGILDRRQQDQTDDTAKKLDTRVDTLEHAPPGDGPPFNPDDYRTETKVFGTTLPGTLKRK